MKKSALHERLATAVGERSYREIGDLTATHPETVRRYMQGQAPSVEFVAALATALRLSGNWLLAGAGPMRQQDVPREVLREADAGALLSAMAETITTLSDRLGRLELFVQTMETRIRGSHEAAATPLSGDHAAGLNGVHAEPHAAGEHDTEARPEPVVRARRIGRAIAQRSRADAD
ncbi:MAG: hypothetical protein AAF235_10840 [Planctomycetota bacterium]